MDQAGHLAQLKLYRCKFPFGLALKEVKAESIWFEECAFGVQDGSGLSPRQPNAQPSGDAVAQAGFELESVELSSRPKIDCATLFGKMRLANSVSGSVLVATIAASSSARVELYDLHCSGDIEVAGARPPETKLKMPAPHRRPESVGAPLEPAPPPRFYRPSSTCW